MGTAVTPKAPEAPPDTKQEKKNYGSCELVMTYEIRRDLDLLKAKIGEINAQLTEDYKLLEERKSFYPDFPKDVEYIDRSIICTAACLAKYACRLFADGHVVMQPDWLTWFARNTEHATVRLRRVYEIMERLIYNTDNNFDPVGLALIKLYCDPGTEVLPSTSLVVFKSNPFLCQ